MCWCSSHKAFAERGLPTGGDGEGGLCASAPAGNIGGDAAVVPSICPLHPEDLENASGQDCDSGWQKYGTACVT